MIARAVPIHIVEESDVLEPVDLDVITADGRVGARATAQTARAGRDAFGENLAAIRARSAGLARPDREESWWSADTEVFRVGEAHYLPRLGVVVDKAGRAFRSTIGGVLTAPEQLRKAAHICAAGDRLHFEPPASVLPVEPPSTVFMAWGGTFNYGHFILDCLTSLLAVERAGLLDTAPALAPPLKPWQRELLALAFPERAPVRETRDSIVRLSEAVFASSMDHFLRLPNALAVELRDRIVRSFPARPRGRRVYISRRSRAHPMRVMVNEAELERALAARGFQIVQPDRLTAHAQIALMREAAVVIGPSGAGMANALFAPPGALVVELQPQNFTTSWIPAFCDLAGHDWAVYVVPSPAPEGEVAFSRRIRRGFRFGFQVPLDDFLPYLDARL